MNVKLPKTFNDLSDKEQKRLLNAMKQSCLDNITETEKDIQVIWLKMATLILAKNFNFNSDELYLFLGNWDELYRANSKLKTTTEFEQFLDSELCGIFEFPNSYIERLKAI